MNENIESNAINPNNGNGVNNKTNTFNLVIGIATLLIAILGATFAYFSATARSKENDVTVKSAYVSIEYTGGTEISASNLIPSKQEIALNHYKKPTVPFDPGETGYTPVDDLYKTEQLDRRCVDSKGKQVCYVYQFSIMSDGPINETTDIIAYVRVNQNEFDNLSYLLYEVEFEMDEDDSVVEDEESDGETDTGSGSENDTSSNKGSTPAGALKDKYGIPVIKENGYSLISNFEDLDDDLSTPGFAKFEKIGTRENKEDGSTEIVNPYACIFSKSDDYDTLEKDNKDRCKPYAISNKVNHVYQLVIWLNETGEEQLEQNMRFDGTIVIEVSGGLDTGEYENGNITGTQ